MQFLRSAVGKKIVMACTGLFMVTFIVGHLLGNSSIFAGPEGINVYAEKLRGLGPFVWIFRIILIAAFSIHVFFAVRLTSDNWSARHQAYEVKKYLSSTFAGRIMIWTGLTIGTFLVYHLIHFTFHVGAPGIPYGAHMHLDEMGRHDIFGMVVMSFKHSVIVPVYILGLSSLFLHLFHGIQSLFQTLGLNNDKTFQVITKAGRLAAAIISLGYISIPIVILLGILRH